MASYGSGFASGLGQGMATGKMLMDIYNENKQKRDLEEAGALDQQVVETGLTDEQKAQVQANREMKLEDGSAAFQVEDTANGVRMRAAGNPDGEWATIAGGKQYKLGNQTQDTEFTKEQIARARNDAIADAYTKNGDPGRGLQYKNAAREDRNASAMEAAREEYMTGLEEMASGKGVEKYIPMILRSYNDPRKGSKYDDSHNATYDPERNVVAFSDKDGRIVNTFPVNQQTMAAAWKERYLDKMEAFDPKLGLQRQELGIKRDTLKETSRHNQAYEGILDRRNGLLGGGGAKGQMGTPLGLSEDGKGVIYNTPQGIVVKALPAGVDGAKLFPKVTGLKGEEAQVEYDDGAGTKIKGTPGQVHNSRMKMDGSYRAANGGDGLAMAPPAGNQTGRAAPNPGKAPAKQSGVSNAELDTMIADAERGGKTGTAYLTEALNSGELNINQRQRVEKALKPR